MLIATRSDERRSFLHAASLHLRHSPEGAMGIVVNQPAANINFPDLLVQLDVIPETDAIQVKAQARISACQGGPVETVAASCCIRPISSSRIRPCPLTRALPHRHLDISQGDRAWHRAANAILHLAMLAGHRASLNRRSKKWLAALPADPELIFGTESIRNTLRPCANRDRYRHAVSEVGHA